MTRFAFYSAVAFVLVFCAPSFSQDQHGAASAPVAVQASTAGAAQTPTAPAFTSKTQLVMVPVVVSRNGAPVTGLKKEHFRVFENGKEQKIAVFEDIQASSSPVAINPRHQPELQQFSNMQVDQNEAKRLVVVVIDTINTSLSDRAYARQELVKYLSSGIDNGALVSLVALGRGRVRIIHDFTSRPEVLAAALDKALGNKNSGAYTADLPPSDAKVFESEANRISNFLVDGRFGGVPFGPAYGKGSGQATQGISKRLKIRETLDGLNLIAQAYAGIPGRKALIWATGGFPFQIDGSTMLLSQDEPRKPSQIEKDSVDDWSTIMPYYEQTWRAMNNANFAVYPIDLMGLVTTNIGAEEHGDTKNVRSVSRQVERRETVNEDRLATFGTFADMTGGRAYYNSNDLARGFKQATADSASYYMLAYYVDQNTVKYKGKSWRKLKVKVDVSDTDVRTRSGYFLNDGKDTEVKDEIELALSSPLDFTGLPVTVRWLEQSAAPEQKSVPQTQSPSAPKKKVNFEILLPPTASIVDSASDNHVSLKVVASARASDATEVNGISQTINGNLEPETVEKVRTAGFTFKSDMVLPPGYYSVRFVVRDNLSGRTGSVAAPLTVN
jgi:VWFA-related protein